MNERDGAILAQVRGTHLYHVELRGGDELHYECSCPVGADGLFCKHCVAAGLAWLTLDRSALDSAATVSSDEVKAYLLRQDAATLTEVIMRHAAGEPEFQRLLALRVAAERPGGIDAEFVRRGIAEAAEALGHFYPSEVDGAARQLRQTLEVIRMMSDAGNAAKALELVEFAVARLAPLASRPRYYDKTSLALYREALGLHLTLCRRNEPDRLRLACWLFEMMTALGRQSDVELTDYAPVLGVEGLGEFRRLVVDAWEKVPVIQPMEHPKSQVRREHVRYAPVMSAIADFTNNHEDYVRLWERDLSSAERFLKIAGVCAAAGKHDRAIEWAERGVKAFPDIMTLRLRRLLAEEYSAAGRMNDALSIVWEEFTRYPLPEQYAQLRRTAEQAGQWPIWREEALELLRDRAVEERKREPGPGHGRNSRPFGDMLVLVQLGEGDVEGAWRSGRNASLSEAVLVMLARARAKTHPLDATVVYRELAEWLVSAQGGGRYDPAADLLLKSARLFKRAGMRTEFQEYLAGFRAQHGRRWRLMRLLDSAKWP